MKLQKPHRFRVVLMATLFVGLSGVVVGRLYTLQLSKHDVYAQKAERQHYRGVVIHPERGDIHDRNGQPLAQSAGRYSVYINPQCFREPYAEIDREGLLRRIVGESSVDAETARRVFDAPATRPLLRRVHLQEARRLAAVLREYNPDAAGYWIDRESARFYPKGVASSVIGFTQRGNETDSAGLGGVELQYNEQLAGHKIMGRVPFSGGTRTMQAWEEDELLAARGNTLVLTLDARIQEATEQALTSGCEQWQAVGGGAVVMDARNGAIIAMASYPTFDNNRFAEAPDDSRRNRTLTDPLETGSVVKLFTAAILLDKGHVTPETLIDCEGGYAVVEGRRLRDSPGHFLKVATFREILRNSSNIGIVKAAQVLENREWHEALTSFGFGCRTGIDLPGEGTGIFRDIEKWTRLSRTSLPMGYEVALTPIQITAGIAAVVNGGRFFAPYVVEEIRDPQGNLLHKANPQPVRQVVRPTTSAIMRDLMEDIADLGTGKRARVAGYRVGGKTGTTRKSDVMHKREYIASFAGALPINDPHLVIYLYVDDPKGEYYAGVVAAPIFREIAEACVLHLGILPSEDVLAENRATMARGAVHPFEDFAREATATRSAILGRMPDFAGMSMHQVRTRLPEQLGQVRFLGTGRVADQVPPPGQPFNETTQVVLHFSPDPIPQLASGGSRK